MSIHRSREPKSRKPAKSRPARAHHSVGFGRATVLLALGWVMLVALVSPAGAQASRPVSDYICTQVDSGGNAVLTFGGHRAGSENLLVDGRWVKTVTGMNSYTATGAAGKTVTLRLRGQDYNANANYATKTCTPPRTARPVSDYICTQVDSGGNAVLTFGGHRAGSENLLVDGRWVKNVTGMNSYTATGAAGKTVTLRLRGQDYNATSNYATKTCTRQQTPPRELAPLEPAEGVLFGAYPGGANSPQERQANQNNFEQITNSKMDIVQIFQPPHQPEWKVDWANSVLANDQIPLITWKVGPNAWPNAGDNVAQRVVNGEFDGQIRARAAQAKQINGPVFSRLFHEMDGHYGRNYDLTHQLFEQYWRRVVTIFEQQGVTNVVWVWTPAAMSPGEEGWYPGDDVVDWIGVDPYLWIGDQPNDNMNCTGNSFKTMEQRIGSTFWNFADAHPNKPIMLAEWGTGSREGTSIRPDYFATVHNAIANHPQLKALVYFNSNPANHCGWRLQDWFDAPAGQAAYGDLANTPAYHVDVAALIDDPTGGGVA